MWAALDAVLRRALGRVRRGQLGRAQERRDRLGGRAGHPCQQVQVVARLLQQPRHGAAPGVAADVGVGVVPERDVLGQLDRHDVTQFARADQPAERGEQVGVAVDVAHRHGALRRPGRGDDAHAVGLVERHRLLQQHVVAGLERGQRRFHVVGVAGGDDGVVGHPGLREQLLPAGVPGRCGQRVAAGEAVAASGVGVGDGHDAAQVGLVEQQRGVRVVATIARTHHHARRRHRPIMPCAFVRDRRVGQAVVQPPATMSSRPPPSSTSRPMAVICSAATAERLPERQYTT